MEDTEDLISVGDLAGHELRLHRMSGNELRRGMFAYSLEVASQEPDIEPKDMLGEASDFSAVTSPLGAMAAGSTTAPFTSFRFQRQPDGGQRRPTLRALRSVPRDRPLISELRRQA